MILVGCALLFLGIKKEMEPLLLVPIGFGAILVNIPLAGLMEKEGLLRYFYEAGVLTEIFPCLIFIGIGAMTDFGPLLENPRILLLGRRRPVRHLPDPASGPGSGIHQARGRGHRHHRRLRRTHLDLRHLQVRSPHAGSRLRGRLLLHVPGPHPPAADHARPDHGKRAEDRDEISEKVRFQGGENHLPHCGDAGHRPDCPDGHPLDGHA